MNTHRSPDILHRWEGNPLITIEDLNFQCASILNAGAVKLGEEYLLLLTIQSLEGFFGIYPARSSDGLHFKVADKPLLTPNRSNPGGIYDRLGVLDPRIVPFGKNYFICYDALSHHGYRVALAKTTDFKRITHYGFVSEPDTKGGILFPRKIKGKFARLERPWEGGSIWISYSRNLKYWGWSELVMAPRSGFWDCDRIGTSTSPIATEQGWLIIYYGVKRTSAGPLFRLGAALLDIRNPARVIGRTSIPILSPRERYERIGDLPNLVFTCGMVIEDDQEIKVYYGASGSAIAMGTTKVDDLLAACLEGEKGR